VETKNAFIVLMGHHFGRKLLGTLRVRKENIRMDFGEIDCEEVRWFEVTYYYYNVNVILLLTIFFE
jgi:hypothetical protein